MVDKIKKLMEKVTWNHVIMVVLGSAAFFYFMLDTSQVQSRRDSIISTQQAITGLEKKLAEAKKFEEEYAEKKKHYAELVRNLQSLQGALPRQFYLPDFLTDILREAKQLEVEITQVTPDAKETVQELYGSMGFNLETKGTFVQFFILLDRLSSMKRLIGVSSIRLVRDSERPAVSLGGDEGVFAETKMSGGRQVYAGIRAVIRLLTYRYRGSDRAAQEVPMTKSTKGG